jgi:hypothetical protein
MRRMPSVSLTPPTGAILPALAGRNSRTIALVKLVLCALLGFSQALVPTVVHRSVPAFLPDQGATDTSLLTVMLARPRVSLTEGRTIEEHL